MALSSWLKAAREDGQNPLLSRPRPGSPWRLIESQLNLIPDFFSLGVEAYGFRGDLCTCARIARVIKQEFDVSYLKAHLSRLLKQPGWTPQKPIDRARQRDEAEIARWRADVWPELN